MPQPEPTILHRTEQWIVLDKPSGWHTVAGRGDEPDIESWLRGKVPACGMLDEAGLVHRLDNPTSGCLLAATDEPIRVALREAMSGRGSVDIRKHYLARCVGGLPDQGAFELYFTKRHRGSRKMTVAPRGDDRAVGRCRWRVLDRRAEGDLVEVELLGPGRRHMLRAGLASLGHPLVGDSLYGDVSSIQSPQLHACRVSINGLTVEAPRPDWAL
ncbi:MAG: RNA pseudouridine synthase [Phycisphaerales bacterium]|nr:RNA pseudouridine synthase [Phycisphaerales bacterium]